MTSSEAPWRLTCAFKAASMFLVSSMGLPFESTYSLSRIVPSSSTSTHFEEVLPPSRPITPRTTCPGSKLAGSKAGTR